MPELILVPLAGRRTATYDMYVLCVSATLLSAPKRPLDIYLFRWSDASPGLTIASITAARVVRYKIDMNEIYRHLFVHCTVLRMVALAGGGAAAAAAGTKPM